ncbi:hypothetical protein DPX16_19572 [Anabarilius grahami]|uniref:Uncharacterized protein n=1 Tax=Anabarilius grahami TaxID=495550 RepID=A0A3N0YNY4_ANAGA|nr:hypothetical protein DPX16_19572 [Anabarilius grahami]
MDQTRPRAGLETRCPAFGVYASCPKLFLGRLVGPYAFVYGSCPCRQNQRQMQAKGDSGKEPKLHPVTSGGKQVANKWQIGCMREHSDMTFISLISDGCVKISQTSLRNEFPVKDEEAWQRLEKSKPDVTATCCPDMVC